MAIIKSNERVGEGIFLLEIEGIFRGKPGQFYMLKVNDEYPLLSRPISIFEITEDTIKFLYQSSGEGTKILSRKSEGDAIYLRGPYGNGFPSVEGKIALVGGGMGAAPLYETGKQLLKKPAITTVDLFLGFSYELVLKDKWEKISSRFFYDIGGYVSNLVPVSNYDVIFSCGPDVMMKKMTEAGKANGVPVYVSIESRMACGIGACLTCTCHTKNGNRKVCKDGPVFLGEDIYEL